MDENIKYIVSFEIKEVTAFTLEEFIDIAAIVVTKTTSNP